MMNVLILCFVYLEWIPLNGKLIYREYILVFPPYSPKNLVVDNQVTFSI